MRILKVHQFDPRHGGGGAERLFEDEFASLVGRGHTVRAFHGGAFKPTLAEFLPDVVHICTIHNEDPTLDWATSCYAAGIPVVWTLADYWPICPTTNCLIGDTCCPATAGVCGDECGHKANPSLAVARGYSWRAGYPDILGGAYVCALNQRTKAIMERNGVRIDAVVPLGVDPAMFYPPEVPRWPVDVYTSSAWASHPSKGFHILSSACAGSGWGVRVLTGLPRARVAEHLRKASIYVFPSCYEETWGLCLTEAMMSGCACVATDVAGAVDQIENGVTGMIVPKRDASALKGAVEYLLENTEARVALQMAAREKALAEFTVDAMAARWEAVYAEAIARAT